MTNQEIEKAVEQYAESLKSIAFENLSGEETPYLLRGVFKEGLESANRYWQEKTRWKSLLDNPPKIPNNESEERQILIKHAKGGHDVKFLISICLSVYPILYQPNNNFLLNCQPNYIHSCCYKNIGDLS